MCRVVVPPPGATWRPCALPAGLAEALGLAGSGSAAGDGWPDSDVAAFEAGLARNGKDFDDTVAEVRAPHHVCRPVSRATGGNGVGGNVSDCLLRACEQCKASREFERCLLVGHSELLAQPQCMAGGWHRAVLHDAVPCDVLACSAILVWPPKTSKCPLAPACCAAAAAPHVRPAGGLLYGVWKERAHPRARAWYLRLAEVCAPTGTKKGAAEEER